MIETRFLLPGIRLHCVRDSRFKQGAFSIQFVRPMDKGEAACNALLPAVLLRGSVRYPDLQAITLKLDDLYGAAVSALVRRIGDYQTTGLYCSFMEDRLALDGDEILRPMLEFAGELLFDPLTEKGMFLPDYVESEKKNLISTIASEINDKRVYAAGKLLKIMCKGDSFGLPRLGEAEEVQAITAQSLYSHYRKILAESPVELFYVGSAEPEQVAQLLQKLLEKLPHQIRERNPQTAFSGGTGAHVTETMDVTQAKLCMGFLTPITNTAPQFAAMQVLNTVFGGGMTSKLFMNVREKLSLCYSVYSGYYGSKGIMTVSAGIDADKEAVVREEILSQLEACRQGSISRQELTAAKEALLSSLSTIHDSPGAIENYYAVAALSGIRLNLKQYTEAVSAVTVEEVSSAARTLQYHSSFFLKGERA
ncbi:MAG: insulinase family protein [Ruminococcaceae bacterium]|nr:insulinase family protein [Oscillospiraceae bacterium]